MAVTVSTDMVFFTGATTGSSSGDTTTDWTGVPTPTVDTAQFIQGAGALQSYSAGATTSRTWIFASASTSVTNKAIYFWFALGKASFLATKVSSGLTLTLESTTPTAGTATWKVAGSDTLPHNGFICHAVDTSVQPDSTTGTLAMGSIIKITITANGTFPGKAYLWVDALRNGTKLSITGGDVGTPATWGDLVTAEETVGNRYGILERFGGVIFVQGKIEIGKTNQAVPTYFADTSQSIVFKNSIFTSSFYDLSILGANGYITTCYMGTAVGTTKGISGCMFRLALATQTPIYTVTATNTYVTYLGMYGCTFLGAGVISWPPANANKSLLSCNFEKCNRIAISTIRVRNNNFINSVAGAAGVLLDSTSHDVVDSSFINCPIATEISVTADYTYNNLQFSGCTYDVKNTSGGARAVTKSNSSNPSTYDPAGSAVTFPVLIQLTIIVKNEAGVGINGAFAYIDDNNITPFIMSTTTAQVDGVDGVATVSYIGSSVSNATWRVRKYGYKNYKQIINIESSSLSIPVTLVVDPQQT